MLDVFSTGIVIISSFILLQRVVLGHRAQRNHNLSGTIQDASVNSLCTRLRDAEKIKRCEVVSCIGTRNWEQIHALENAFGLDSKLSATVSGPLKPRYNLWELEYPQECSLLLDADFPATSDDFNNPVDPDTVLRMCSLSKCVVVYLNNRDIKRIGGKFELSEQANDFLMSLSKKISAKSSVYVHIVIPEADVLLDKPSEEEKSYYNNFKKRLSSRFCKSENFSVKGFKDSAIIFKNLKTRTKNANPREVANIISSRKHPNLDKINVTLEYLKDKCFQEHNKLVEDYIKEIYSDKFKDDMGIRLQASITDSALAFYLRSFHLSGCDRRMKLLDLLKNQLSAATSEAYLRLMILAETEAISQLRTALARRFRQPIRQQEDTDEIVKRILSEYDAKMMRTLPIHSPPSWFEKTLKKTRTTLKDKLESIISVHSNLPQKSSLYRKEEEAISSKYKKNRENRGISFILAFTAMIREHGYGNRQAFVNYNYGPLMFTIGFERDQRF